jgi:hypothetical protein
MEFTTAEAAGWSKLVNQTGLKGICSDLRTNIEIKSPNNN